MAKLTFYGGVEEVTGSAYLLETDQARVLFECGLVQGSPEDEARNRAPFPFSLTDLDAVVLSHAHLDHSGRLPKLVADGYAGRIYATRPTVELLDIMLKDAAFLAERDAAWENKRRRRADKPEIEPLYDADDVDKALAHCHEVAYGTRLTVAPGVDIRFKDAGHILGSAIVEVFVTDHTGEKTLVFSGDLGNPEAALMCAPEVPDHADVVLLESTYGDRNHKPMSETLDELADIVSDSAAKKGNILIPAFAVGRTQEIIFRLGEMYRQGALPNHRVFLDSPMAIAATEVYQRYAADFNEHDSQAMQRADADTLRQFLPTLRYSRTTEESMMLNRVRSGAIIIAGSGMCSGGRIRHHLKHNLWRAHTQVVIVGFQVRGTPGRALVDGAKTFRVDGEEVAVKAKVHTLGGFSAHAGQAQLLDWVGSIGQKKPRVYLVHGESDAKEALRRALGKRHIKASIPGPTTTIDF